MRLIALAAAVLAGFYAGSGQAEPAFPARPISIVVPFAAGGPTDSIARILVEAMGRDLGVSLVVVNDSGHGGNAASARVARAAPDGYTLLLHHQGLPFSGAFTKDLTFDAARDFQAVGLVSRGPFVLTARAEIGAQTVEELLRLIRESGKTLVFAHAGRSSASYLCMMQLLAALGTQTRDQGFSGTAPAMDELVAGKVDLLCDQTPNAIPQIRAGRIRPYAVTTLLRFQQLQQIPTLHESGLPGFESATVHALYAPRGTSPAVVLRIAGALDAALRDPMVQTRFSDLGLETFPADQRGPHRGQERFLQDILAGRGLSERIVEPRP